MHLSRSAALFFATLLLFNSLATAQAPPPGHAVAHCINVGQADCTILEFKCGVIMIDVGSDAEHDNAIVAALKKLFDRRTDLDRTIQAIFITHPHIDHDASLKEVVENFKVMRLLDGGEPTGSGGPNLRWIRQEVAANRQSVRIRELKDADVISPDGLTDADIDPLHCDQCDPKIHILAAAPTTDPGWESGAFENMNNHSLVIRIDFGGASLLFTGDLEEPAIESLLERYNGTQSLDADVYHVGHHGSLNGTTPQLLRKVTPQIAMISMGKWDFGRLANGRAKRFTTYAYGHPRIEILNMLQQIIPGYRSDAKEVMAGLKGGQFQSYNVRKRIYGTGWDGTSSIDFSLTRDYRVRIEGTP